MQFIPRTFATNIEKYLASNCLIKILHPFSFRSNGICSKRGNIEVSYLDVEYLLSSNYQETRNRNPRCFHHSGPIRTLLHKRAYYGKKRVFKEWYLHMGGYMHIEFNKRVAYNTNQSNNWIQWSGIYWPNHHHGEITISDSSGSNYAPESSPGFDTDGEEIDGDDPRYDWVICKHWCA